MDEKTRSKLNAGLESLVVAARMASLSWDEHMALNNAALEIKSLIDGKGNENEGTPNGGPVGGK
jgi:hypothetical protein